MLVFKWVASDPTMYLLQTGHHHFHPQSPDIFRSSSRLLTPTVPHPEEEDDKNEKGEESCYEEFEEIAEHHITLFDYTTTMRFALSQVYGRIKG